MPEEDDNAPRPLNAHDERRRYCPMLGHDLAFGYCRCPGRELPCGRIFDCWFEAFDVEAFLRAHYSERQIAEILAPRQDKRVSLYEMIRKAQQRGG